MVRPSLYPLLLLPAVASGLDNGVGLTPAMGYNTWDDFRCGGINASNLYKVADAMVAQLRTINTALAADPANQEMLKLKADVEGAPPSDPHKGTPSSPF